MELSEGSKEFVATLTEAKNLQKAADVATANKQYAAAAELSYEAYEAFLRVEQYIHCNDSYAKYESAKQMQETIKYGEIFKCILGAGLVVFTTAGVSALLYFALK